jgi:hypothetical protein
MTDFVLRPIVAQAAAALDAQSSARPALHRRIETLTILVFWLLVLEGSLRKWAFPQFAQYLFFIRDPFVLLIYWYALQAKAFRTGGWVLKAGIAFAILAVPLAAERIATVGDAQLVLIAVYGWRQYFLYLPLPFVIAATFTPDSFSRFLRHVTAAVAINAPLVLAQFHSPPGSVINRGIAEDLNLQFQSFAYTGGLIRPSGTFTSTVGVTELVASSFALLLAAWLMPPESRKSRTLTLFLAATGAAMCLSLSGSRSAFIHSAIVVLCAMLLGSVTRRGAIRSRALLLPSILVVAIVVLYPIVFPDALAAMISRVKEAGGDSQSEAVLGRALYETVDFLQFVARAPLAGYGLGLGGNGRSSLTTTVDDSLLEQAYAESDWSRHIVDLGPIVGVLFILYRIGFTVWLFARVIGATRRSDTSYPLLLFGYVGIGLFYGQLTGHGTVGGFLWIYLGLCLASCNVAVTAPERPVAEPRAPPWKLMR